MSAFRKSSSDWAWFLLPHVMGGLIAFIMFLWGFEFVAEHQTWTDRTVSHLRHAGDGLLRGGVLGLVGGGAFGAALTYIIGGVGIAAMGTAFAAVGLPVIAAGAAAGAFLGGFVGGGVVFWRFVSAPSEFVINFPKLLLLMAACALTYAAVWFAASRVARMM